MFKKRLIAYALLLSVFCYFSALKNTQASTKNPLFIGFSIHVEGWVSEYHDEDAFKKHADAVDLVAQLFYIYGAKLNIEVNSSFVASTVKWGYKDLIKNWEDLGHTIGVHADVGYDPTGSTSLLDMTLELIHQKEQLEKQNVDIKHVTGVCSDLDWVQAVANSGFLMVGGIVEYCLKSLHPFIVPAHLKSVVLGCASPEDCHGYYPYTLEENLVPWKASSGDDWVSHDTSGDVTIMASMSGITFKCLAEEILYSSASSGCDYNSEDITIFTDLIDESLDVMTPSRTNYLYFSWSIGDVPKLGFVIDFLSSVRTHISGKPIRWESIPGVARHYESL